MTYIRPTILELRNAVEAIRGSTVKSCCYLEADGIHYNGSVSAYEADE